MRPPHPLPEPLRDQVFTRTEARSRGVTDQRLRSSDVVRLGHGLYAGVDAELGWPAADEAPGHGMGLNALRAILRQHPGTVLSHATAAHVFGLPVPDGVLADPTVHLTWPSGTSHAQRHGIRSHRCRLSREDRVRFRRLDLTGPARTWVDLAADERLATDDLVVIADAIVNRPWRRGQRVDGLDTLDGLSAAVERARGSRGIKKARLALARSRVGADSPPETRARLALVEAGLPEPELQAKADPHDPWSPYADLGYRDLRIAIQYDGKHHRSKEQQAADAHRDAWFQQHGWLVIRLTWVDLQQGFVRLIRAVRERVQGLQ